MDWDKRITISFSTDERLNGLGMMLSQYLEQNFEDFEYKVEQGLRLKGSISVEVENKIATSIIFNGSEIRICNGVITRPDMYLAGSYLVMTKILTGQITPISAILRKKIVFRAIPRHLWRSYKILRFLKIPQEMLINNDSRND